MPIKNDLISIVRMSVDDLEAVKQIEVETNLSAWHSEDYQNELKRADSLALVVKLEGKTVGFSVSRLITNLKIVSGSLIFAEAEILSIAISESFQNQSLGTRLLQKMIDAFHSYQISKIWLEVRESSTLALRFYKRSGFQPQFKRSGYYSQPFEDAIILCKILEREVCEQESELLD